jgi:uncharacterized protein DUF6458
MGVGVGLILIAFGAILAWGVDAEVSGLNVTAIGVILLVLGIFVVLLDLVWWRTWTWYSAGAPWRRTTYVHDTGLAGQPMQPAPPRATPRRRVVVDEEDVGGPPPGPPPP